MTTGNTCRNLHFPLGWLRNNELHISIPQEFGKFSIFVWYIMMTWVLYSPNKDVQTKLRLEASNISNDSPTMDNLTVRETFCLYPTVPNVTRVAKRLIGCIFLLQVLEKQFTNSLRKETYLGWDSVGFWFLIILYYILNSLSSSTDTSNLKGICEDFTLAWVFVNDFIHDWLSKLVLLSRPECGWIYWRRSLSKHNDIRWRSPSSYRLSICISSSSCRVSLRSFSGSYINIGLWDEWKSRDVKLIIVGQPRAVPVVAPYPWPARPRVRGCG